MDKKDSAPGNPLYWFLGIMVLLWFLWFVTGGPERAAKEEGVFLKPPSPLDTGETYGDPSDLLKKDTYR